MTPEVVVIRTYYALMKWFARSQLRFQILHWGIEDEFNVGDELYIRSSCQYCCIFFRSLFVCYLEYLYNKSSWKHLVPYSSVSCYECSV